MKTTAKNFKYFKERCEYWRKELGLVDWSIFYDLKELEGKAAETNYWDEPGVARIVLSKDWGEETPTENGLNRTALHECCHILFSNLTSEAKARYAQEYDIDRAEHHIIRVLENILTGTKR